MNLRPRHRRAFVPGTDNLEPRGLLSGGMPSLSRSAIEAVRALIPPITGVIHGTVTQITPLSATSSRVAYTARGKADVIGDGEGAGQHIVVSKPGKNGTTVDTYKNGSATVTGTTDTVSIRYKGTGRTNADGSFTATWKGTARSVAGQNAGLHGSFTARIGGPSRTGDFTISITIRV